MHFQCGHLKKAQTKAHTFAIHFPSHSFHPLASLHCGLNENREPGAGPILMNTHDPQVSVRAVCVRETGVAVRGGREPF